MKVNVDFYVLNDTAQKSLVFACQKLDQYYQEQKSVYVYFSSQKEAEQFDALLWTYQEDSFVPHQLYRNDVAQPPLIQLGIKEIDTSHDVLFNLSREFPSFFAKYKQVVEIVFADGEVQQLARERFKKYRELGCEMNTVKR